MAHRNRYEGRLHETPVAIVVVRIQAQPQKQSQDRQDADRDKQLRHWETSCPITIAAFDWGAVAIAAGGLPESLPRIPGHTGLELAAKPVVVQLASDQHQLVLAGPVPVGVIDGEALASQVEHMAALTLIEPENALGAEHPLGELIIEKILKFA